MTHKKEALILLGFYLYKYVRSPLTQNDRCTRGRVGLAVDTVETRAHMLLRCHLGRKARDLLLLLITNGIFVVVMLLGQCARIARRRYGRP